MSFARFTFRPILLWTVILAALTISSTASPLTAQTGNNPSPGSTAPSAVALPTQQPPQRPFPPLSPDHRQYLEQLLSIWEQSSSQVKRYTCDYMCWEYDPEFCNWRDPSNNRLAAYLIKSGTIRFLAPDKARFETERVWGFDGPPEQAGQEPQYKPRAEKDNRERWICDGKAIYEYDFGHSRLYETRIPPEMQGDGLVNSPLPFLFGAKKDQLLDRFWIRVITPEGAQDEYWLEAWPKRRQDAQNYRKLELIIAREDFLPKSLQIFAPNYDPIKNPISRVFEFKNRKVNSNWSGVQNAVGWFVRPQTPIGWERVDRNALPSGPQAAAPSQLNRQSARPNEPRR